MPPCLNCFAPSEIRTHTVTEADEDGNEIQVEQTYTVVIPIEVSLREWNRVVQLFAERVHS